MHRPSRFTGWHTPEERVINVNIVVTCAVESVFQNTHEDTHRREEVYLKKSPYTLLKSVISKHTSWQERSLTNVSHTFTPAGQQVTSEYTWQYMEWFQYSCHSKATQAQCTKKFTRATSLHANMTHASSELESSNSESFFCVNAISVLQIPKP